MHKNVWHLYTCTCVFVFYLYVFILYLYVCILLVCLFNFYLYFVTDDHSRVVLDPLPNDPNSDYINANFVDVSIEIQSAFSMFQHHFVILTFNQRCNSRKISYMLNNSVPCSSLFFDISLLTAWMFQCFYSFIWRVTTEKRRTLHHKVRQLTQDRGYINWCNMKQLSVNNAWKHSNSIFWG